MPPCAASSKAVENSVDHLTTRIDRFLEVRVLDWLGYQIFYRTPLLVGQVARVWLAIRHRQVLSHVALPHTTTLLVKQAAKLPLTIGGSRTEEVGEDETITINGARCSTIKANDETTVGGGRGHTVASDDGNAVGGTFVVKAGQIELRTAGGSIVINSGGKITISGVTVKVQSTSTVDVKAFGLLSLLGDVVGLQ